MIVYVVTEAYGASAVAETFTTWADALAYAKERASNYRHCAATWAEHTDHGCELYEFSAKWDPHSRDPKVARRFDLRLWPTRLRGAGG